MMKALLFCPVHGNIWAKRYFPDHPLYLLPFANKPAITYALDYCSLALTRSSELMEKSRQSKIQEFIEKSESELEISSTPPYLIK